MNSSVRRICSIGAILFLVLGFAGNALATGYKGGVPWQVGDVIICFGGGSCNVVRIVGGVPKLLDQFSDVPPLAGGDTRGVAINNTLHAVVTDNGGGGQSNVVVYTIASLAPSPVLSSAGTPVPHIPVTTSNASPNNAQAVVVNSAGHIFVGNAGSGGSPAPSIVELNPNGTLASSFALPTNPFPLTGGCSIDTAGHLLSLDLSKDGSTLYLTSNSGSYSTSTSNGGNIQKLTLATGTCTPFASFGSGVALNGVQDVPPSALPTGSSSCKGNPCPSRETVLAVAEGFFDSDGDPGAGELVGGVPDSGDDVNICTNAIDGTLVSCALLLDTGGPGLTASPWRANNPYPTTGAKVLDANLHVQQVATPGTSGTYAVSPFHPAWNEGGTTVDNRVTWTDGGAADPGTAPDWAPNTPYTAGAQIQDSVTGHIQNATTPGTSGPASARPSFAIDGTTTFDGLTWTDLGTSVVARYPVPLQSTLQTLTLDPLVRDCSSGSSPNSSGSCPTLSPTVGNFWLGDSVSANFYMLDFANGTPTMYDANANASTVCPSCSTISSIQGLHIYGGEGANQADLTKLASGSLASANGFTQIVQFPLPTVAADTNTMTLTVNGAANPLPFSLYGSLIAQAAPPNAGNNSGAADGNIPCEPTTSAPDKCIVWKVDVPTPTTGGPLSLPVTSFVSTNFAAPVGIDNGTHVFLDEHYDVTTFVGTFDPGGGFKVSVYSLQEVPSAFTSGSGGSSGCFYVIAGVTVQSGGSATFKSNRSTLPIEFRCPDVTPSSLFSTTMNSPPGPPQISIVKSTSASGGGPKPAPQPIQLTTTNTKAPYRFNGTDYIFNWTPVKGKFDVCTFDPTNTIQSFCATLNLN